MLAHENDPLRNGKMDLCSYLSTSDAVTSGGFVCGGLLL
jgi:hypothetical protein